ncbi:hypothetical protein DFH11DRAFT_89958 [Phellopilus nigrolimitatus]|nr:hypothetical protein DFH11DRAFT_89958 [Phellopilus nigrolimitatus]
MNSSSLASEAQLKELVYHVSWTLAREQGLKVAGRLEQILERLLNLQAKTGPEHDLVGHSADNEGAASCSASDSATATKENIGTTPQESTERKRKAEEIEPEKDAPTLSPPPPSPQPSPGARQRPPVLALRVSSSHHLIISTMAPERTQKRTAARRHICTPSRQVPTVSRQRTANTPNAPGEPVAPYADSAASATEQEIPSSARKARCTLIDSGVDNLKESSGARKYTGPLRRSIRLRQALSPLSTEKLARMHNTIVHDLSEFKPNIVFFFGTNPGRFDVALVHPHVQLYTRTRDSDNVAHLPGRYVSSPWSCVFATSLQLHTSCCIPESYRDAFRISSPSLEAAQARSTG